MRKFLHDLAIGAEMLFDEAVPRKTVALQVFIDNNLALSGNSGGSQAPRIFTYKTDDAHATVDTAGYFNDASDRLKPGDMIDVVVVAAIDADPEVVSTYGRHIVLSNAAGVVDVSNVTVGVVTDTD